MCTQWRVCNDLSVSQVDRVSSQPTLLLTIAARIALIVDVQPIGPRVVLPDKAIELGVSYALEGGADGIAIPWPGAQSFEAIQTMCSGLPVWVKPGELAPEAPELVEALGLGAAGFWLDERFFAVDDPAATLQAMKARVHMPVEV